MNDKSLLSHLRLPKIEHVALVLTICYSAYYHHLLRIIQMLL